MNRKGHRLIERVREALSPSAPDGAAPSPLRGAPPSLRDGGKTPFWERKTLRQMTRGEWESLCDGCGLCCLVRFEDEETGEIIPTRVHCRLYDAETCGCADYANRKRHVPDCIKLTPGNVAALEWMPKSCAYRRVHEGRGLAEWHPLISGDRESVHRAGVSVRGQTISEGALADPEDALDFAAWDLVAERGTGE